MAGWIIKCGDKPIDGKIIRFRKIYDLNEVPDLFINTAKHSRKYTSILWTWGDENYSDVAVTSDNNENVILLCGAPTSLGKYGLIPNDISRTSAKILDIWRRHGDSVINEINGSWSLCVFNLRTKATILYVDRFASRSMWFTYDTGTWLIGNFASVLAAMQSKKLSFNPSGLYSLFNLSRHMPGEGLYDGMITLKAGQKAILKLSGKYYTSTWWSRRYHPDYSLKPKEWGYNIAHALRRSSQRLQQATKEAFLYLSGGLDSRIAAAAYKGGMTCVTLFTKTNPELQYARMITRRIGLKHIIVKHSPVWFIHTLKPAALISSGNYHIRHAHYIIPTIKLRLKHEYASFMVGDILENLNKHYFRSDVGIDGISEYVTRLHEFDSYTTRQPQNCVLIFKKKLREKIQDKWRDNFKKFTEDLKTVSVRDEDHFDTYFRWADISSTPTYIMINSVWPFASERNIALDNDLDDISRSIPSEIRRKKVIHNWILWHMDNLLGLIPNASDNLPVYTPKFLHDLVLEVRPKLGNLWRTLSRPSQHHIKPTSGCWPLWSELYRKDAIYINIMEDLLSDPEALPDSIFDHGEIDRLYQAFINGDNSKLFMVNGLLSFGYLNKQINCSTIAL